MNKRQNRYKDNCKQYKLGEEKCRYLCCGIIGKDQEPLCYNPMIKDVEKWDRIDAALREFAREHK